MPDQWITVHPNGEGSTGAHVLLGASGEVKAGMGGKFNGQHISQAKKGAEKKAPSTQAGHHEFHRPLKIEKETEKAVGVRNEAYHDARETARYDVKELSSRQIEALRGGSSLTWLPKSQISTHEGHVVGAAPWLAKREGYATKEGEQAREAAFSAGKKRYSDLLSQAKAAGVPGVRERMKTETIKQKMRAHGLTVDSASDEDEGIDYVVGATDGLIVGKSPETISANIAELIRSGRAPEQAAAIAYHVARGEDQAAGVLFRAGNSVLLLRRCASTPDFPNTWGFPGGGREAGETLEQTAIRECSEEIGQAPPGALDLLESDGNFTTFVCDVPAPFVPTLNEEHSGYVWAELGALPGPMHPGAQFTLDWLASAPVAAMDERVLDVNGWFESKRNPISKVGIFLYSGRALGGKRPDGTLLELDRMYRVYRPAEELGSQACIDSFKLLPWVNDHTMLGPVWQQMTPEALPAEAKGVDGVIGEEVFFENGTLYGNIKAFSNKLAALIAAGKRELSAGYRCVYDWTAGTFEGQPFDCVQRSIRGNHLALVQNGRMGPDVAVMDRLCFTFDALEMHKMADPEKKPGESGGGGMSVEQLIKVVGELAPQVAALNAAVGKMQAAATGGGAAVAEDKPEGEDQPEGTPAGATMDAAEVQKRIDAAVLAATKPLQDKLAAFAQDSSEAAVIARVQRRESLVRDLSRAVGAFDHSEKTYEQVVQYGIDKLELGKDANEQTLRGYLSAVSTRLPAARVAPGSGMDAAPSGGDNFVSRHLAGATK